MTVRSAVSPQQAVSNPSAVSPQQARLEVNVLSPQEIAFMKEFPETLIVKLLNGSTLELTLPKAYNINDILEAAVKNDKLSSQSVDNLSVLLNGQAYNY